MALGGAEVVWAGGFWFGVLVFCLLCWGFVDLLCLLLMCGVGIIYFTGCRLWCWFGGLGLLI